MALLARRRQNLDRIARGVHDANALLKQFTDHPADAYQLLLRLAGQIAFESALAQKRGKLKLPDHVIIEFSKLIVAAHLSGSRRRKEADLRKLKQTVNTPLRPQSPW
jgi:hypothetical protein